MRAPELNADSARSASLDGMRALAAISVLAFHVWLYQDAGAPNPRAAFSDKLLFEMNMGLICFFVLSGFLLYQAFARASLGSSGPVEMKGYVRRRVSRIVPAYYVNLIGCLLLFWAVGLTSLVPSAEHLPLFAVFSQNYSPETVMRLNPVTWTLSVEAALYLTLPLIGLLAVRLGPRRAGLHVAFLMLLIGVTVLWNAYVWKHNWLPIGRKVLPTYIGHFALGMLAALWFERRRRDGELPLRPLATAGLLAAGAALVVLQAVWRETDFANYTNVVLTGLPAAAGFALMIAAVAAGRGPAVAWLSARPLVAIGVVSYGLYLWHLPLLLAARELGLLRGGFALRFVIVFALAGAAAALSWRYVEQPLIRRSRERRRRAAKPAAPTYARVAADSR